MSYNNKNTLLRIIQVQDIVFEQKKKGISQCFAFENIIRDAFQISFSTFNRWLAYPAKQKLKQYQQMQEKKKKEP